MEFMFDKWMSSISSNMNQIRLVYKQNTKISKLENKRD